jgi:PurA ssDNA and RNA-binding protein
MTSQAWLSRSRDDDCQALHILSFKLSTVSSSSAGGGSTCPTRQFWRCVDSTGPSCDTLDLFDASQCKMSDNHASPGATDAGAPPIHVNGEELISIRVTIETKVLFIALRRNTRGLFLKLAGDARGGVTGRTKLILPGSGLGDLRAAVVAAAEQEARMALPEDDPKHVASPVAPAVNGQNSVPPQPPLHSERFSCGGRRVFIDLHCNAKGRYVKLAVVENHGKRCVALVCAQFPEIGYIVYHSQRNRMLTSFFFVYSDILSTQSISSVPSIRPVVNLRGVGRDRRAKTRRGRNNSAFFKWRFITRRTSPRAVRGGQARYGRDGREQARELRKAG